MEPDIIDDQTMEEAFDFASLSLEEPEERLRREFEESLHLYADQDQQPGQSIILQLSNQSPLPLAFALEDSVAPVITASTSTATATSPTSILAAASTLKAGPAAAAASTSVETMDTGDADNSQHDIIAGLQPGVTLEALDAMAVNPNHVFKSAQTPFPFPFSVPPSTTSPAPSTSARTNSTSQQQQQQPSVSSDINVDPTFNSGGGGRDTNQSNQAAMDTDSTGKGKDVGAGEKIQEGSKEEDTIPQWMLEDSTLTPIQSGSLWSQDPVFTSQDFTLDWPSGEGNNGGDFSTMVDPNALFGFSSYPTYETLPISGAIADEQYRRATANTSLFATPSETTDGGFARYAMDGQLTNPWIESSSSSSDSNRVSQEIPTSELFSASSQGADPQQQQRQHQHSWQDWRSVPQLGQDQNVEADLDLDLEYSALDDDDSLSFK
ncbi:hypothetical protein BGZ98_010269 [Dissophora globulifera]|nr:hypothetical protein BGZ98_010269 [Dissophora globulifera]